MKINIYKRQIWQMYVLAGLFLFGAWMIVTNRQSQPAHATGGVSFELFATHPYASKTGYDAQSRNYYTGQLLCTGGKDFCPVGQEIRDMGVTDDGKLIAGYGDWNGNVDSFGVDAGGIYLQPLNLTDRTWGNAVRAGSESLDVIREFGGEVYAPTTDPSDKPPAHSGYVTTELGPRYISNGQSMVHVLDMVRRGNDIWQFGSIDWSAHGSWGAAYATHSPDNGQTWEQFYVDPTTEGSSSGYERYYWAALLGDKIYFRAQGVSPQAPLRVFDTITKQFSTGPDVSIIGTKDVVVFDGHIVSSSLGVKSLEAFDGVSTKTIPSSNIYLRDLYVARDGYLYALSGDNKIYRTHSLAEPLVQIGTFAGGESTAYSIAVYGDYVYIGSNGGKIYRSMQTIANAPPMTPEIATINRDELPLDGTTYTIRLNGDALYGTHIAIDGIGMPSEYDMSTGDVVVSVDTTKLAAASPYTRTVDIVALSDSGYRGTMANGLKLSGTLPPSSVETTPTSEACFSFDASSGSIVRYYTNEHNNSTSPACPNYVMIPHTIAGAVVSKIGLEAFAARNIVSVVIPGTITDIGVRAFYNNNLTSVVIPDGVTNLGREAFRRNSLQTVTIGNSTPAILSGTFRDNQLHTVNLGRSLRSVGRSAFAFNQLRVVRIPAGVETISEDSFSYQSPRAATLLDDMSSSLDTARAAYNSIYYTRLVLEDPSNPHSLMNGASMAIHEQDVSGTGASWNDSIPFGGHIISAQPLILNYVNVAGIAIRDPYYRTGRGSDGTELQDYTVKNGPTLPDGKCSFNADEEAFAICNEANMRQIDNALKSSYYHVGDTVAWFAPEINGYSRPNPNSGVHTLGTTDAINTLTLRYLTQTETYSAENNQATHGRDASLLARTGSSSTAAFAIVVGLYSLGAVLLLRKR